MSQIAQNLQKIRKTIFKEAAKGSVKLVAVTKTRHIKEINEAISCGVLSIGENRVQEAEKKFQKMTQKVEKRLVGRLQSNKIKKAIKIFDTIDSVSSYSLAKKISEHSEKNNKKQRILLQINTSEELSKNGFSKNEKTEILNCFSLSGIKIEGLMTIAPNTKNKKERQKAFRDLKKLFFFINDNLSEKKKMTDLSMGMSDDLILAIKEGSTMVRVGTSIFGKRTKHA